MKTKKTLEKLSKKEVHTNQFKLIRGGKKEHVENPGQAV